MARIAGIDLPRGKRIEVALTYIYGIGRASSRKILEKAGIDINTKSDKLKDQEIARIREIIEREYKVEGDLRRDKKADGPWMLSRIKTSERVTSSGTAYSY